MGLFTKKKTSTDYLKEIAETQKQLTQANKEQSKASKAEAFYQYLTQNDENFHRHKSDANVIFEEKKVQLQAFYDSFNFDMLNANDIIQKSMVIISWLDTVDRDNNKATINEYTRESLADDNNSKEKTLIKKLCLAVDRLEKLDADKKSIEYIKEKLKSYEDRAVIEKEQKHKKNARIVKCVLFSILACFAILYGLWYRNNGYNPAKNGDDCKTKVVKLIENGKIEKASQCINEYVGYENDDDYIAAKELLSDIYLKDDKVEEAIKLKANRTNIVEYLIKKGQYDEAYKECVSEEYNWGSSYDIEIFYKNCVTHMCENNKLDEAKQFIKRYSLEYDNQTERNLFIKKMNSIINLYQTK